MTGWQERLSAFIMFMVLFLYLGSEAYKRHENIPSYDWRSEIRADGAGYYVYLPMWFDYGYNAADFPEDADIDSGGGFSLNDSSGVVKTKYFCGTALMLSPFYLGWKAISNDHVFSDSFNRMVSWSASFIMALSALLLFYTCRASSGNFAALFSVFAGIFATTAFYYTVQNPMWSHVWSFFTVSLLLFLLHKKWEKYKIIRVILLGLFSGLLVVTRPTNALLLLPLYFFEPSARPELNLKNTALFLFCFMLPWIPQVNYWKWLSGDWCYYTYSGEGFHHLSSPGIARLLFEPMCGLFPWTPIFLVFSILLFTKISGKNIYRYNLIIVYSILIYLFSSWSAVNFGNCGFGSRSFTELVPLFLPLLSNFMRRSYLGAHSKWWILCGFCVILCLTITRRLNKDFAHCYEQSRPYDFRGYNRLLFPTGTSHESTKGGKNEIILKVERKKYYRTIDLTLNIEGIPEGEKLQLTTSNNLSPSIIHEGEYINGRHAIKIQISHFASNPITTLRLSSNNPEANLSHCSMHAEVY